MFNYSFFARVQYLTKEYRPPEYRLGEVGYHVGGFDRGGRPCLFHIFWGFDRPKPPDQKYPEYRYYSHRDDAFLYNGRNDLADAVVRMLIGQVKAGEEVRFNLTTLAGLVMFCDFVVRFAAEMTPQVGPPFLTHLIFPDNSIETIRNDSFCPINLEDRLLKRLGAESV